MVAVLDASGSVQAAVFACGVYGPAAIRLAATRPHRVRALILFGSYASYVRDSDCPWGAPPVVLDRLAAAAEQVWGTGAIVDLVAPSRAGDTRFREWSARGERLGGSAHHAAERIRSRLAMDARPLLADVHVPTLVLHRRHDRLIRVDAGRYLAQRIDGAKYVELPGEDNHFFVGDSDALLDEVEEFLTGTRTGAEGEVVLATVLFTDIVNSTAQAAAIGHRTWSRLTEEHDASVRAALSRHGGRAIKTMGDGYLATFDGTNRAVRCALEIVKEAAELGLELRAGLHNGEIEVRNDDVGGLAVTIGKRICDLAGPGEVLISETVKGHLVGSAIAMSERGTHVLKGVPQDWRLFAVGA